MFIEWFYLLRLCTFLVHKKDWNYIIKSNVAFVKSKAKLKFILSEKHTKFDKIFLMVVTNQLIYLVNVKTMRKILSNYVSFSKSPKSQWLWGGFCYGRLDFSFFWMNLIKVLNKNIKYTWKLCNTYYLFYVYHKKDVKHVTYWHFSSIFR